MPDIGRYIEVDPIGIFGDKYNNPYTYVENNVINKLDPAGLYGEDVHFDMTYNTAVAAGIPDADAYVLARADADVDRFLTNPYLGGNWLHFMSRDKTEKYLDVAIASGSLSSVGKGLHLYQDTYSHQGYKWYTGGHASDSLKGLDPDIYRPNHSRDMEMARMTFVYLRKFKEQHYKQRICK